MTIKKFESRDEFNSRCREYYSRNKEKLRMRARRYYARNKGTKQEYWKSIRARFFEIYGSQCVCCGEKEPAFLTLNHKSGNGNQERKKIGNTGVYLIAIKNPDHSRYETFCFNCNVGAKLHGGVCPHKLPVEE